MSSGRSPGSTPSRPRWPVEPSEERREAVTTDANQVRYLPVGRAFVSDRIGLPRVWHLLWAQHPEFLGSEGKNVRSAEPWFERLPVGLRRGLRASSGTLRFAMARRRRGREDDGTLQLPLDGEVAIVRRSGAVKVLDTRHGRVLTLMPSADQAQKLRDRIHSARAVEAYPFAPRVMEAAPEQGWFSEEFVRGIHPTGFHGCLEGFGEVYLPLLVAFARAETPDATAIGAYACELAAEILAPDGLLTGVPAADRETVTSFVEDMRDRLAAGGAAEHIPLVLSHGDFYSGNLVVTPSGEPRAIDWAHLGRRSPLYDLYFLVMNHCTKVLPPERRRARITEMIGEFRARLAREDPLRFDQLDAALTERDELRWLFYLECIQVPLKFCDDPADRYVRAMVERVAWFMDFERALGATVDGGGVDRGTP
jgi:hypothetical protein